MKKFLIFFVALFLFLTIQISAQYLQNNPSSNNQPFILEQTMLGDYSAFNVDALSNIYLITSSNQLKKIKPDGTLAAVYNDVKRFGRMSSLDVRNPLKVLAYYKNYSAIIILDKLLTFRNAIELKPLQFFNVNSIANSYDNNIWIFDEQNFKIKKIDDKGFLLLESIDIRNIVEIVPTAEWLIDEDNQLFLIDLEQGVFVFDYYGAYIKKIPLQNLNNISVENKCIIGFSKTHLEVIKLDDSSLKKYTLPQLNEKIKSSKFINNKLYILTDLGLNIYRFD